MKLHCLSIVSLVLSLVTIVRNKNELPTMEDTVLESLDRSLTFLMNNSDALVPDIVYGIVLARGQISVLRRHLQRSSAPCVRNKRQMLDKLRILEAKSDAVANASKKKIPVKNEQEFDTLVKMILRPEMWEVDQPLKIGTLPQPRDTRNVKMTLQELLKLQYEGWPGEPLSDHCLGQVLGGDGTLCKVSPECWRVVLINGSDAGYPLTHRLLYVQVARQAGCNIFGSDEATAHLVERFCSKILDGAQLIENLGFPISSRDLFSEQVALCGMEGFTEYLRPDWLKRILSWQRPNGCFGDLKDMKNLMKSRRRKRDDGIMADDCLMHFTGVSMGAVSMFLRPLINCVSSSH